MATSNHTTAAAQHAPLVSVITVCRNAAATLEACLRSVAAQDGVRVEHVVIDGASTDGTAEVIARHRAGLAVVVSEPDGGLYDAMNKGVARAGGDFIIFLNADDVFAGPGALRDALRDIAGQPDGDVYYGTLEVASGSTVFRHVPPPPDRAAQEMVTGCLPHQATLARREVFARTGPFDVRWRRHADYDWWLKVLADPTLRLRRIGTVVARFALGGASSDLAKGQPEVFAIQNASPLYRTPEWDSRRIALLQQAWLEARLEVARLQEAARSGHAAGPRPSLRHWVLQRLPPPVVAAIRAVRDGGRRVLRRG